MLRAFTLFPLMILPVLLYNFLAVGAGGGDDASLAPIVARLDATIFSMPMLSGSRWQFTVSDGILLLGLMVLFVEIVKATSTRSAAIVNHAASMFVMLLCLIEFLLLKNFSTSTFFLLTVMSLLDVLAGVMVTIVSARRDFGVGDGFAR